MTEPEINFQTQGGAAHADTLEPFDVRDSSGRQGLLKLGIAAAFLLALAFIVLNLYKPGVRDRNDPPRITADNTPFKVAPTEPGGTETPDQDKAVFGAIDGTSGTEVVTPAPEPETPVVINTPARSQPDPEPAPTPATRPVRTPPPTVQQPTATQPAPVVQTRPSAASGNSTYVVQVASVRSQGDADAVYAKIAAKFSGVLPTGSYSDVKRVDLAEKGIYYRTRIAGLSDKPAATELCAAFKAAGQACFVTRK